jgi:cysteine-rich repeat protein
MKRAIYSIPISASFFLMSCAGVCGDETVDEGEECDDGNAVDTDTCPSTCLNPSCGDSFVQSGVEECDDANTIDNDACTNDCNNAECGDGILFDQAGGVEECDDGNNSDTDDCPSTCENALCGDGFVENGVEDCDDANNNNNDGCTNICALDPVIRSFEITTKADANLTDVNDANFYCGIYCSVQCDETFTAPLVIDDQLDALGSYDRDRVCVYAQYSSNNTYNLSGTVAIGTSGAQYNIALSGNVAINLTCTMDNNFNLDCLDGNGDVWKLTAQ